MLPLSVTAWFCWEFLSVKLQKLICLMFISVWMQPDPQQPSHPPSPPPPWKRSCACLDSMFGICLRDTCGCVSTAAHTESISLHEDCQCVLPGQIHGSPILGAKPGKKALHQSGSEGLLACSWQLSNMQLSVFIYLLLNDLAFKPRGLVFPSIVWKQTNEKKKFKKPDKAVIFPVGHSSKSCTGSNFEWKVFLTLEMNAFESSPF